MRLKVELILFSLLLIVISYYPATYAQRMGSTNSSEILGAIEQRNQQELANRTPTQGQQNWSTYEDPILGIQFQHPSWWRQTIPGEDLIKFYHLPDPF